MLNFDKFVMCFYEFTLYVYLLFVE